MDDTEQQVRAGAALLGIEIQPRVLIRSPYSFYFHNPNSQRLEAIGFSTWKQALSIITDPGPKATEQVSDIELQVRAAAKLFGIWLVTDSLPKGTIYMNRFPEFVIVETWEEALQWIQNTIAQSK